MPESATGSATARILITLAAFVVIIAGMRAAAAIIVPFLLALFLSVICAAPAALLQRRGVPVWLSIVIVIFGIMVIGTLMGGIVGASMGDFVRTLPRYNAVINARYRDLLLWLEGRGLDVHRGDFVELFQPAMVLQYTATMLGSIRDVLANGVLILITVVFMLLEASSVPAKLRLILDRPDESMRQFERFAREVKRYLVVKTWVSLATGFLVAVFLSAVGLDYPILWGMLAFVLNYIPTIGSIIASVPAILLAIIQLGWGWAALIAGAYLAINLIMSNLVEPRVMGQELGLSTLVVFLSLLFWGWVLGPLGMVLSVPLTVTVRIALEGRQDTRWLAVLLGRT